MAEVAADFDVFRGVFPAASLKPEDPDNINPRSGSFPRGIPRGLIEAGRTHAGENITMSGFPRGIPRGLIEAATIGASDTMNSEVFRGVFPAASLKPSLGFDTQAGRPGFPRGIPRGLIEA